MLRWSQRVEDVDTEWFSCPKSEEKERDVTCSADTVSFLYFLTFHFHFVVRVLEVRRVYRLSYRFDLWSFGKGKIKADEIEWVVGSDLFWASYLSFSESHVSLIGENLKFAWCSWKLARWCAYTELTRFLNLNREIKTSRNLIKRTSLQLANGVTKCRYTKKALNKAEITAKSSNHKILANATVKLRRRCSTITLWWLTTLRNLAMEVYWLIL